jgi:hypothetical protein
VGIVVGDIVKVELGFLIFVEVLASVVHHVGIEFPVKVYVKLVIMIIENVEMIL